MAAAAPYALSAGAAFLGKRMAGNAAKPTPWQATSMKGAQTSAAGLGTSGAALSAGGAGDLNTVTDYYTKLAKGDRGLLTQTLLPETRAISDVYRGANKNLERAGVVGPQRDVAEAELGREKASKISSLISSARPAAVAGLDQLGRFKTSQGSADTANAGNLDLGVFGGASADRARVTSQQIGIGSDVGKLIFSLMKDKGASKSTGGGGGGASGIGSLLLGGSGG